MLYINLEFEWDEQKALSNVKKHGVSFYEASGIWQQRHYLDLHDRDHSGIEDRWIRLGFSGSARVLVVVYTIVEPDTKVRIISARLANKNEHQQLYRYINER